MAWAVELLWGCWLSIVAVLRTALETGGLVARGQDGLKAWEEDRSLGRSGSASQGFSVQFGAVMEGVVGRWVGW